MYLWKFGAEKLTGLEDKAQKRLNLVFKGWWPWNEVTLEIKSRSPKSYQLCILPQWYNTLSLARIQCSIQEMYKKHSLVKIWHFKVPVTLKIRSRSPKSSQSLPSSQQCMYASLVKIHQLVQKITCKTIFWIFQSAAVTLKIRSRSLKLNQLFPFSQQCIYASLVKIHPLVQEIRHGNHILDISKWNRDLGNYVKVTKIWSTLPFLLTMYLCKFGQNSSTSSEDSIQKPCFGHFKVPPWPWK